MTCWPLIIGSRWLRERVTIVDYTRVNTDFGMTKTPTTRGAFWAHVIFTKELVKNDRGEMMSRNIMVLEFRGNVPIDYALTEFQWKGLTLRPTRPRTTKFPYWRFTVVEVENITEQSVPIS
jgi:hypothetical protein